LVRDLRPPRSTNERQDAIPDYRALILGAS
jgi:hypothetical protein